MAGYIGPAPVPQATQNREAFTATSGQTSFATAGYTPQFIDVYLNGVKLAAADYTATNGSDVVLASGATVGDILEVVAFSAFTVADQAFTGTTTAANLTVTGAFTSQGIDDNANAVAITIDSSENVGIGTSSPSRQLHLSGSTPIIRLTDTDTNAYGEISSSSSDGNLMFYADQGNTQANTTIRFYVDTTERMRIDSSGNLLVGKTTIATGTAGIALRSNGEVRGTANGDYAARFSRLSSDGAIVGFEKDNVAVGSIGIQTGGLTIDGEINHTGLMFAGASVLPRDNSANTDGTIDLGTTDGRWKDLYLSGNAYADNFIGTNDTNTFIAMTGGDVIRHFTGGSERVRIDNSGNVGISNSSPSSQTAGAQNLVVGTSGATGITIASSNNNNGSIFFADGTSGNQGYRGYLQYNHTSDFLTIGTAATERMRIDSSGNVGIGSDNPLSILQLGNGSDANIPVTFAPSTGGNAELRNTSSTGSFTFTNANGSSEKMRLDTSGNLLVGKTSSNSNTVGIELTSSDLIRVARSGGATAYLNRKTNDGDIITFAKDGSTVGNIGTFGGTTYFSGNSHAIMINGTAITPSLDTGNRVDNAMDLGASGYRFKDLHLSGGVYLGGTGAANKLDDYEEGTFTPTLAGSTTAGTWTYTHQSGSYTKIGNTVTVLFNVYASHSGAVGSLKVLGMPFASNGESVGTFQANRLHNGYQSGVEQYAAVIQSGETHFHFRGTKGTNTDYIAMYVGTVEYLRVTCTYTTNS